MSGIDAFELGRPYSVDYQSAGGANVATDAAANFSNVLNAVYLQDEIYFPSRDIDVVR